MNNEHKDQDQQENSPRVGEKRGVTDAEEFVAPGAPVVRSSTPRPLSFISNTDQARQQPGHDSLAVFPPSAPSAPPLPEEDGESEQDGKHALRTVESTPLPGRSESPEEVSAEFLWLFEYGLEMDLSILNGLERLNGLAMPYGPAVLKGYEITFDVVGSPTGQVAASILPGRKREAEVWGVLYRIPGRLVEQLDGEPALLDKIHLATSPDGLFERLAVSVHEAYRGREITCITYIASAAARNQFRLLPDRQAIATSYVQRLLEIARKQKLPDDYLQELAILAAPHGNGRPLAPGAAVEQNTEPLPVLIDEKRLLPRARAMQRTSTKSYSTGTVIFALYLVLLLLVVFIFAILQVSSVLPASFGSPGIPWFVLVYGFTGGCLSCIVSLGRHPATHPPTFILITWFTRPCIGIVLAIVVFLLLNSGLFALSGTVQQDNTLYSLLALLAGSCEGLFFYKSM